MRGMEESVEALRTQARATLDEAEALLGAASPATIINRAYYSAFYTASSMLMARDLRPKSHRGVVDLLHREFVRQEHLDRELVKAYGRLYTLRLSSDYGPFDEATPEAAHSAVVFAREFLETADKLLGSRE